MRILLTNDDGIHAPGLKVLEEIAREFSDDIWICAPSEAQKRPPMKLNTLGWRSTLCVCALRLVMRCRREVRESRQDTGAPLAMTAQADLLRSAGGGSAVGAGGRAECTGAGCVMPDTL